MSRFEKWVKIKEDADDFLGSHEIKSMSSIFHKAWTKHRSDVEHFFHMLASKDPEIEEDLKKMKPNDKPSKPEPDQIMPSAADGAASDDEWD